MWLTENVLAPSGVQYTFLLVSFPSISKVQNGFGFHRINVLQRFFSDAEKNVGKINSWLPVAMCAY